MKNLTSVLGLSALTILLLSCSRNQPEKVADEFLGHVQKGELEKAGELGTEKTKKLLSLLGSTGLKDSLEQPGYLEFRELDCEVEGDTARCSYQAIRRDTEGPEEENLLLVKQAEGWRVDMEKDQIDKER